MNSEYILLSLVGGIALCFALNDPPNRIHPISWLGKLISKIIPRLKDTNPNHEKLMGVFFTLSLTIGITMISYFFSIILYKLFGIVVLLIYSVLVLKFTMAILTLETHVNAIIQAIEENNLIKARKNLSLIVGRNTETLDRTHILSATIESIGESMVDGIGSILFYFSIFGPAGAIAYRIINTLDSMIGYTDTYHYHIGWMAAKLDTLSNYIPARLCAVMLVLSSKMVGGDWKNSVFIMRKDHKNTPSLNGGYPMSALAGALKVKLEKIGYYELGTSIEPLSVKKCKNALTMVKVSVILFFSLVCAPIVVFLSILGWWNILYV
ncbi:MAG TPA: cobalamin biosynthesis protein [Nitrososphaeraceae archaeon]|jgi:adenosylcobinamide-phosphate synthase|nr:cobalamin biosynthesis protein [Nitrososphaeraceae archaeon]